MRGPVVERLVGRGVGSVVALALLLPVAGCGEDPVDAYCSKLEADRPRIAAMIDSDSPSPLLANRRFLHDLADAAPSDVADEWQTFLAALDGLQKALDRAGVKPSSFVGGKPPAGLTATQKSGIADAVAQLGTDDTLAAASGIEQQARDVCKVNFGL